MVNREASDEEQTSSRERKAYQTFNVEAKLRSQYTNSESIGG